MVSGYVKQFLKAGLIALVCLVWGSTPLWSREAEEYKVKAAFIYNFIKFVQWPKTAFPHEDTSYRVCVVGDENILRQFKVIDGKKYRHRTIQVVAQTGKDVPGNCHVVFISSKTPLRTALQMIRAMSEQPVLIIGETKGFIGMGGSVNFFFQDDRLQFEINPDAAGKAGLEISSRLLKLAVIVEGT